jgi:hypothetical protein
VYNIHYSTATCSENLLSHKRILGLPILDRTHLFDDCQLSDLLLTLSDIPIQIVTDDHVMDRAVLRWREPKYLTYSNLAARATSFFNWPQHLPNPSPDALSKGFFYTGKCDLFFYFTLKTRLFGPLIIILLHMPTGIGDKTICFHCGCALIDLGFDDHPFSEHAAWFPCCVYVNYTRDPDFVGDCECVHYVRGRWNTNTHAKDWPTTVESCVVYLLPFSSDIISYFSFITPTVNIKKVHLPNIRYFQRTCWFKAFDGGGWLSAVDGCSLV